MRPGSCIAYRRRKAPFSLDAQGGDSPCAATAPPFDKGGQGGFSGTLPLALSHKGRRDKRPNHAARSATVGIVDRDQIQKLRMKAQTHQSLRKCAGRDLRDGDDTRSPAESAEAKHSHSLAPCDRVAATRKIEVMVELVREEDRAAMRAAE